MEMKRNAVAANGGGKFEEGNALSVSIDEQDLSTLVDMAAMACSEVCDGEAVSNDGFRRSIDNLAQSIFKQAFDLGGADAAWKDPEGISYEHPTFGESGGEAWEAVQEARKERFEMDLVEIMADALYERSRRDLESSSLNRDHYEHLCQDLIEAHGPKYMVMALMS